MNSSEDFTSPSLNLLFVVLQNEKPGAMFELIKQMGHKAELASVGLPKGTIRDWWFAERLECEAYFDDQEEKLRDLLSYFWDGIFVSRTHPHYETLAELFNCEIVCDGNSTGLKLLYANSLPNKFVEEVSGGSYGEYGWLRFAETTVAAEEMLSFPEGGRSKEKGYFLWHGDVTKESNVLDAIEASRYFNGRLMLLPENVDRDYFQTYVKNKLNADIVLMENASQRQRQMLVLKSQCVLVTGQNTPTIQEAVDQNVSVVAYPSKYNGVENLRLQNSVEWTEVRNPFSIAQIVQKLYPMEKNGLEEGALEEMDLRDAI